MDLLNHFLEENKGITIFNLKDDERDALLAKLPIEFKRNYITDIDLDNRIRIFSSTKEKELSELLPTKGSIKSGDFGEMLSYFFFSDKYRSQGLKGPRKWRWKEDKNVAAPYSDVILFAVNNISAPSINDLLVSVESKMKSTSNKDYHPIQNAIDGAQKDYITRMANSLNWLRKKYKEASLNKDADEAAFISLVNIIERFIKSETIGEYTKKVKAVAIVDKTFLNDEISKGISLPTTSGINLEIFVISIKDLKDAYEKTYDEILKL